MESDCTRLCKYIHIVVKCGPRQYEKERCELRQVPMLPAMFLLSISGVDDLTGFMLTDEITDRTVAHRLQSEFNAEAKAVILKMKRQAARDEIYSKKLQQEEEKQHRGRGSKRVSERHQKAQKRQEKETEGQGEGSRIKKKRKVAEPEREQAEEEAKRKQERKRVQENRVTA